jgi:hypothetical protein
VLIEGALVETRPSTIVVEASANAQVEIAETLTWLTAAVRSSPSSSLMTSKTKFIPKNPMSMVHSHGRYFSVMMEELEPYQGESMCWHHLFKSVVVACQFPIAKRGQGIGLELSPTLMTTLAGTIMSVSFQGGSILKGLSTALIPIEKCEGEEAIQWHLFVGDSSDGSIEFSDFGNINFLKVEDASSLLSEERAYLGWCQDAKVLLGTGEADCRNVNWSDASEKQPRFQISGFSTTVASSKVGMSTTVNFTPGKGQRDIWTPLIVCENETLPTL